MAPLRHRFRILALICATCGVAFGGLFFAGFTPLTELEFYAQDSLMRSFLAKRSDRRGDLVFLAIDHASITLDQLAREEIAASPTLSVIAEEWPWPRIVYARILDRLIEAGAKAVIFDVLFPSPRQGDEAFRAALDRHAGKVVIGSTFVDADRMGASSTFQAPSSSLVPPGFPLDDRVGAVNFQADIDEVVRRLHHEISASEIMKLPPADGDDRAPSLTARAIEKLGLGSHISSPPAAIRFRFAGPPGTFRPHSVCDLFAESVWRAKPYDSGEFFRDKIVMIGAQGPQMKDQVPTPFGLMDGAEVHLNALNATLNQDWLREARVSVAIFSIAAGAFGAWLLTILIKRPILRMLALPVAATGFALAAQALFNYRGIFIPAATGILTLTSGGILCLAYDLVLERLSKTHLRSTLERYVSKEVAEKLLDNKESYLNVLGGVRRDVTVLFSDIRGFTPLAHRLDSVEVVARLNEYFGEMVEVVLAHHGTLDKFMGDAIMAEWGTLHTEGVKPDAELAVAAALEMHERLARLNESWRSQAEPEMRIGIGINHGEAVLGNIGSQQKMELTVIGDAVNLASRLQDLTKSYKVNLLLGETAARLVDGSYHLRTVDRVSVAGRAEPLTVFTVAGRKDAPVPPEELRFLETYERGIADYQQRKFTQAAGKFEECLRLHPEDALSSFHRDRCLRLAVESPDASWDGVTVFAAK
jgi:adenylate cyclase